MVKKRQSRNNDQKNILELIIFAISALLITGLIVYLIILSAQQEQTPPDLSVEFIHEPTKSNKNIYHVWLHNRGGETAENVKIELELYRNRESVEKSELEIEFSPKKSKREGWITFSGEPQSNDSIASRVLSYKKP